MDILISTGQILAVGVGTAIFGILLGVSKEDLIYAGFMGAICQGSYLFFYMTFDSGILATFIASLVVSFLSIFLSKFKEKPMPIFLATGLIPLLPGYYIFKTILGFVEQDGNDIVGFGYQVVQSLAIIVVAIVIATSISRVLTYLTNSVTRLK